MNDVWESLRTVFCHGHRQLADGLRGMIEAIEDEDCPLASKLAEDLDRRAGPHVEFEERYLYPVVEDEFGEAYATKLYEEHAELIATLIELQQLDLESRPSSESKARWLECLNNGLSHLNVSQTLLNYLRPMSTEQKAQLLQRHQNLLARGHRWSQLHPTCDDPSCKD